MRNWKCEAWRGTSSFKLNAESKETKLLKKRWYVAHVLCITFFFFFSRGPEGEPGFVGFQVLSTPNNNIILNSTYMQWFNWIQIICNLAEFLR